MSQIFDLFGKKVPKYNMRFRESMFKKYSIQGGTSSRRESLGKVFETNYELYSYAFFIGLYLDEYVELPQKERVDFSQPIQFWGNKSGHRENFSYIQKAIFSAVIVKEKSINWLELEKGNIAEDSVVKTLISSVEAYTNGGLIYLDGKINEHPGTLSQLFFLELMQDCKK